MIRGGADTGSRNQAKHRFTYFTRRSFTQVGVPPQAAKRGGLWGSERTGGVGLPLPFRFKTNGFPGLVFFFDQRFQVGKDLLNAFVVIPYFGL